MTDTPAPAPTVIETVARMAAEAAVAALADREKPAPAPPAPAPAVPAEFAARVADLEDTVALLLRRPTEPAPLADDDRRTIDDLRLKHAELSRRLNHLDKEND